MSLLKKIISFLNKFDNVEPIKAEPEVEKSGSSTETIRATDYLGWTRLFGGGNEELSEKDYYKNIVFACMNARAENIAKATFYLYKRNLTAPKKISEMTDHLFLYLVNGYNLRKQSFADLLYLTSINLDFFGNCYWWFTRDVFGAINSFYILPTTNIKINLNKDRTFIENYEYNMVGTGKKIYYYPDEIIHFQIPNFRNLFKGIATVDALRDNIDIDYLQRTYQKNYFKNDASLGTIVSIPNGLNDEEYDRLILTLNERKAGVKNAGCFLILEGDAKTYPFTTTPKESDYIKSRQANRDEILSVFRTPKTIVGLTEGINYASSLTALNNFIDNTIRPFAKLCIENKLNIFIKENFDERLFCKMEYDTYSDPDVKTREMEMLKRNNIITTNEVREAYNYESSKDKRADELFPGNSEPEKSEPEK